MATARLSSEAKANTKTFGVLASMVVHQEELVCGDDLACISRKEYPADMPYPSRITTKYGPKENSTGGPVLASTAASMLVFG
jgi:hypothetical protein